MTGPIYRSHNDNILQPPATPAAGAGTEAAIVARRIIKFRRRREALLGAPLFADPAWDMLLDLLVAEDEGRAISVSSLCIAANVPATTALRWIAALADTGQITRQPHERDRRVMLIGLVPETSTRLRTLLGEF